MSGQLLRFAGRHVAKSNPLPASVPFRWLRVYGNDAGLSLPAAPTDAPTGTLLAELDLSAATWTGSPATLANTISTAVLADGWPLYVRAVSADGLTATDTPYAQPANEVDATQEIVASDPPDDGFVLYPGPWLAGTTVEFDPGDLVYTGG